MVDGREESKAAPRVSQDASPRTRPHDLSTLSSSPLRYTITNDERRPQGTVTSAAFCPLRHETTSLITQFWQTGIHFTTR